MSNYINMKNKKLIVAGRGTVGCLTVAHFLKYTSWDIEWVFDPSIPTTAVGEGTSLIFPRELHKLLGWQHDDLNKIQGTVKQGIYKENWGIGNKFLHPFPIDSVGMHLSALDFQNEVYDTLKTHPSVTVVEKNVIDPNNLDSDFVMMCTGSQDTLDDTFVSRTSIPVNSAYVTQCYWDYPKFTHTLTIAMPWGWVFGIPLQKRCAIGYMYNKDFASLETVKDDVKEIFKQYDLVPSNTTRHLQFNNYSRVNNFSDKIVYNGNASFFLEPLEATSTGTSAYINRYAWDVWNNQISTKEANAWYQKEISDVESMICLHYMSGSIYKNNFWDYATSITTDKIQKEFENRSDFATFAINSLNEDNAKCPSGRNIGSWPEMSYYINIKQLGLESNIEALKNQYFL